MGKSPNMPKTLKELKVQLAVGSLEGESIQKLIRSKKTSKEILRMIYRLPLESEDRGRFIKNPNTPTDILEDIYAHRDTWFWADQVLQHPSFPLTKLLEIITEKIMQSSGRGRPYQFAVYYVLRNIQIPADILTRIANHSDNSVRVGVAKHPNTPVEVLQTFKNDNENGHWDSPQVAIAENPNTPPELLHELLMTVGLPGASGLRAAFAKPAKTSAALRKAIAENPNTHTRTLWYLASKDSSATIRGNVFDKLYKRGQIVIPIQ